MSEIANQTETAPPNPQPRPAAQPPPLHKVLDDLSKVTYDTRQAARAGAHLAGTAPASFLLPLLRDKNPMIRFAAVEALRLGDYQFSKVMVDTLLSKIDDRQNYIATAAIKALGRKRVADADEELISCLTMEDSRIASAALLALSEIGTSSIDEYVEEFLHSREPVCIRAAARVVARHELSQFGEKMVSLTSELADDAEINPQSNRINHALLAIRAIIAALGAIDHRDAIPRLKELGLGQIGLRSAALRTLHQMGIDVIDMACQAQETFASANISRLLAEISKDFADDDAALVKLNQHLNCNQDKLADLGDQFAAGITVKGRAIKVAHGYAIIELQHGVSAYLPAVEYCWSTTKDLQPLEQQLLGENHFQIVDIDHHRGRVKVSRRQLLPDPLAQFHSGTTENTRLTGTVHGLIHFGVFIELQPGVVGLLHVSKLALLQDELPQDHYRVGDRVEVIVEGIDLQRRRIRLDLA